MYELSLSHLNKSLGLRGISVSKTDIKILLIWSDILANTRKYSILDILNSLSSDLIMILYVIAFIEQPYSFIVVLETTSKSNLYKGYLVDWKKRFDFLSPTNF